MSDSSSGIDGVIIKRLTKNSDGRGWLIELFRQDELPGEFHSVMGYISMTLPGESRGPHEHKFQSDYFCMVGPSTFRVYFWDNRSESPTFKNHHTIEAGEKNMVSIIVPPGVVHGYKNIGKVEGVVFNAPDRLYRGVGKDESPDEIRYENDPDCEFSLFD